MANFTHVRGDSFEAEGSFKAPFSMASWTGRAHLRATPDGQLIDQLQFTWIEHVNSQGTYTNRYSLSKMNTSAWPFSDMYFDVEVHDSVSGRRRSTPSHKVAITKDYTHD